MPHEGKVLVVRKHDEQTCDAAVAARTGEEGLEEWLGLECADCEGEAGAERDASKGEGCCGCHCLCRISPSQSVKLLLCCSVVPLYIPLGGRKPEIPSFSGVGVRFCCKDSRFADQLCWISSPQEVDQYIDKQHGAQQQNAAEELNKIVALSWRVIRKMSARRPYSHARPVLGSSCRPDRHAKRGPDTDPIAWRG